MVALELSPEFATEHQVEPFNPGVLKLAATNVHFGEGYSLVVVLIS